VTMPAGLYDSTINADLRRMLGDVAGVVEDLQGLLGRGRGRRALPRLTEERAAAELRLARARLQQLRDDMAGIVSDAARRD
jgi:hypothetical protein